MLGCYEKSPLAASHFDYISKVIEVVKVHYVKGKYTFTDLVKLTRFMKTNPTRDSRIRVIHHTMYILEGKNKTANSGKFNNIGWLKRILKK